jgi:hypothetical protein
MIQDIAVVASVRMICIVFIILIRLILITFHLVTYLIYFIPTNIGR